MTTTHTRNIDFSTIQADEQLMVMLLKKKSKDAFAAIYKAYSQSLYICINRIIKDEHLSEDILQEAFVKIWNNIGTYDKNKGRLYTWMRNICHNAAIDQMRSRSYKAKARTSGEDKIDTYNSRNAVNYIKPEIIGVNEIVNKMKPEWRSIVQLIYFNGYTQMETASELNIPLGTVKTRLRGAMSSLKKLF